MEGDPKLKFQIPEVGEIEGYAVERPDGTIELRTKEQLEKLPRETPAETVESEE